MNITKRNLGQARPEILVIDDEAEFRAFAAAVVEEIGCEPLLAATPDEGVDLARNAAPRAILLDLQMPGCDGVEVLRRLAGLNCRARIVLASGFDSRVLHTALRVGRDLGLEMVDTLFKPIDLDKFESTLRAAVCSDAPDLEELRHAFRQGELVMHYQPKIDLRDPSAPYAVEALVRWQHPKLGLLPPDRFLPLAAEAGLMVDLTFTVLDQVLCQMAAWAASGLEMKVAVNVPPTLLADRDLPVRIGELTAAYGIDPGRLILEVVETAAADDTQAVMDVLARLRLRGIEISIDDFGVGHSSMLLLYRMPFSELKIDRSFISRLATDEEARTIVKASIDLAHNLRMTACVEGVETGEVLAIVRELGADSVQGFHFSRPLPPEAIPCYFGQARSDGSETEPAGVSGLGVG